MGWVYRPLSQTFVLGQLQQRVVFLPLDENLRTAGSVGDYYEQTHLIVHRRQVVERVMVDRWLIGDLPDAGTCRRVGEHASLGRLLHPRYASRRDVHGQTGEALMAAPIVDCQTHLFPAAYGDVLARNRGTPNHGAPHHGALLVRRERGAFTANYGEVQQFRLDDDDYSPRRKLRDMDEAGVDVGVISVNMPGPEQLDVELAEEAARVCNDELADICAASQGRFVALACLPWQLPDRALAELARADDELGVRGAMLFSHVGLGPVDAPAVDVIYAELARRRLPLVLHPCVPSWAEDFGDHSMVTMLGLMVDHSLAALRLVLGGVLERHPELVVVQPHCGGVLPYLWGRIRHQTEAMGRGVARIASSPTELYRRVYLDTASPWPSALRLVYEWVGAERMLFGSDHPWVSIQLLLDSLRELQLPAAASERILGGNASNLFAIG